MMAYDLFLLLIFPGILFLICLAFFSEWIDRKFFARVQNRYGPLYTGPSGIFQPLADFIKLLSKEDITPKASDGFLFNLTPILYATLPLTALFIMPIMGQTGMIAFEGDLIFLLFIFGLMTIIIFLAGWSSMSRFSIIGSVRSALQMLSYEIPLGLVLIGPAIAAKSLSVSGIVQWQSSNAAWVIWLQPIGFLVLMTCLLAELELIPFDIPEADTEIVAGWRTEFSGRKLAMFRLGRDLEVVLCAALATSLFLGGAQPIWVVPPVVAFLLKTIAVIVLFSFIRSLFARFRIDQVISGMWKYLLPVATLQIILVQIGIGV
jgi:NADH-quinone oxidoreductase subunit H